MARAKKRLAPALTPEAREKQLISYAIDLAEQQILDGTASSQVICHYLKLGSTRQKLENEKLVQENELLKAKTESLEASRSSEALYQQALDAMRSYSGIQSEDEQYD